MIALNELSEYAAEVPFTLPLVTDPLSGLTGHVWVDAGDGTTAQVQIRLPGGAWANATISKIVEKGYGRYAVRLTAVQCAVAGSVLIYANVATAQPYRGYEPIGEGSGDILVGGSGHLTVYMANESDPVFGAPVTGHVWTLGQFRVCYPNGVYQDAVVADITELGNGLYTLSLASSQTLTRGKVYYQASIPGAQRFEAYAVILTGAVALITPSVPAPTPIAVPVTSSSPLYYDHTTRALNRLCEQFKVKNVG